MSTPHDYYNEYGELRKHSRHNSRTYVDDNDYIASDVKDQLPIVSSIGAGPQGPGVIPEIVSNEEGEFEFVLKDTITGEVLLSSGNLSAGSISVSQPDHTTVSGEVTWVDINVKQGKNAYTYSIAIPPGAVGSRWFIYDGEVDYSDTLVYEFQESSLLYDGTIKYIEKPTPRPNDLILFVTKDTNDLVFGNIEAVEKGKVTVTARNKIGVAIPSMNAEGNWTINGRDTGIKATGPTGPRGPQGEVGPQGKQGPKGETGSRGPRGYNGTDGKDGQDGLDAHIQIGAVTTLPPGSSASASCTHDSATNTTTLNFGIPEGTAGRAINIRGGIWKIDYLPRFQDTPVNDAFIVYDEDKQFDLYVRGSKAVQADDGGPWTVVENWQGRPGSSVRYMLEPKILPSEVGESIEISTAEAEAVFAYYDYLADDDLVIDSNGTVGIISSAEDNSGTYVITTVGAITISTSWEDIVDKPDVFPADPESLQIVSMNNDGIVPKWDKDGLTYISGRGWIKPFTNKMEICICSSGASAQDKIASMRNDTMQAYGGKGAYAYVLFTQTNTANNPTLSIYLGETTMKGPILSNYPFSENGFGSTSTKAFNDIKANVLYLMYFNGTNWIVVNPEKNIQFANLSGLVTTDNFSIVQTTVSSIGERLYYTIDGPSCVYGYEDRNNPGLVPSIPREDVAQKSNLALFGDAVWKKTFTSTEVESKLAELKQYIDNNFVRKDEMEAIGAQDILDMIEEARNNG